MFNTYTEMAHLKDLFTSKFDSNKLYECVMETKSGCLLQFFTPKQLDTLKPYMVMHMLANFKSDVIRAYNNRTSNKITQAIMDYCMDYRKTPDRVITLAPKDLEWILAAHERQACDVVALRKNRFKLSPKAKDTLLLHGTLTQIGLFKDEISDKDYAKFWKDRLSLIPLMKKPTVEMLRAFYADDPRSNRLPEVDYYPVDMLVDMVDNHWMATPILEKNDKRFGGLLKVYWRLHMNQAWNKDYGIEETSDDELKAYEQLVNDDVELLKVYVKDRLLKME